MSKRIVFCADGTWDDSAKNSNPYRLYKGLKTTATQIPYYDDGVGSDGLPIERLAGGAFGAGLFQKIKDGYSKIAQVYETGDEIFLFGFSRGAYTVRSLAGMIAVCGLPTAHFTDETVDMAFEAYRNKDRRAAILTDLNNACDLYDAKITMIGVWDTVGSLGIPAIFGGVSPLICGFLDTSLHADVVNAYQALAIDERRGEFPASLWSAAGPGQTMEQVWFAGVHCDVGGSYADDPNGTALSDITLAWMMNKATALGLEFVPAVQSAFALPMDPKYALDTKHESWNLGWAFPRRRHLPPGSAIADSVAMRIEHDSSYRPENLTIVDGKPDPGYRTASVVTQRTATAGA